MLNQQAENDPFNRLVTGTGLEAQEADWLRAFYRYLRQTGMGYTIYTVVDALQRAPAVTTALIDLFTALHDPAFASDREAAAKKAEEDAKAAAAAKKKAEEEVADKERLAVEAAAKQKGEEEAKAAAKASAIAKLAALGLTADEAAAIIGS